MQVPSQAGEDRRLAPEQRRVLLRELRTKAAKFPKIVIHALAEREPRQYAKQFSEVIESADIKTVPGEIPANVSGDVGVFVTVLGDLDNSPDDAVQFMNILRSINLEAQYIYWIGSPSGDEKGVDFSLYIARPAW